MLFAGLSAAFNILNIINIFAPYHGHSSADAAGSFAKRAIIR
jgi:hypothetical protein